MGDFYFMHYKRSASLLFNKIIIGFLPFNYRSPKDTAWETEFFNTLFLEDEKQPSAREFRAMSFR